MLHDWCSTSTAMGFHSHISAMPTTVYIQLRPPVFSLPLRVCVRGVCWIEQIRTAYVRFRCFSEVAAVEIMTPRGFGGKPLRDDMVPLPALASLFIIAQCSERWLSLQMKHSLPLFLPASSATMILQMEMWDGSRVHWNMEFEVCEHVRAGATVWESACTVCACVKRCLFDLFMGGRCFTQWKRGCTEFPHPQQEPAYRHKLTSRKWKDGYTELIGIIGYQECWQ